jgi:hypothetical protein
MATSSWRAVSLRLNPAVHMTGDTVVVTGDTDPTEVESLLSMYREARVQSYRPGHFTTSPTKRCFCPAPMTSSQVRLFRLAPLLARHVRHQSMDLEGRSTE